MIYRSENNGVDYLRLSVTDKCNLSCMYCAPIGGKEFVAGSDILTCGEILRLVKVLVGNGIRKVRITGGEPLLRKDIIELVKMLRQIDEIEEISLTTNGVCLEKLALPLWKAGIDRINISLDSLKRDRFKSITGVDAFDNVVKGIHQARNVGLEPVKVNVVPMASVNDDEIIDFVKFGIENKVIVRFIELFSTNESSKRHLGSMMINKEVIGIIENEYGSINKCDQIKGNGPAEYYTLENSGAVIGFISPYSSDFCSSCSRVRVDCSGKISSCLFSGPVYDSGSLLRSDAGDKVLFSDIKSVLSRKRMHTKFTKEDRLVEMSSLGG